MSEEKWPMAGSWEKQDEAVIDLADYLYFSLDEEGWADHRNCGDPDDGMCGKEWAERSSVLNIARNLLREFPTTHRPEESPDERDRRLDGARAAAALPQRHRGTGGRRGRLRRGAQGAPRALGQEAQGHPMTAHDPRVTLTEVLTGHVRLPMMHSQGCTCGWQASLSHPDLHRAHLAERLEEHFSARLAPIRALADGWEATEDAVCCQECQTGVHVRQNCGEDLRAALEATGADPRASQDHDGDEGQDEGEKAGEGDRCNRRGQLDRSVCGFCHDAYVECTRCGVYSCACNIFPCDPKDDPR